MGRINGDKISQAEIRSFHFITSAFPVRSGNHNSKIYYSGSSFLDPEDLDIAGVDNVSFKNNTQKCVSRFGIQDFVGNVQEQTIDRVFCDTSSEKINIWYGPSIGDFSLINSIEGYVEGDVLSKIGNGVTAVPERPRNLMQYF